ncbi:MAG: MBL fold metallo-hydrolase [Gammaproteobacteria bacterium]|nr:MBL fold metallo-hydrolase [Gammaproteobacteria bacterium]
MNNNLLNFGAGALALLLSPLAVAQFGSGPAELELIELRDDMYVISNPAVPGLVTALITDEGVLLVDNKFEIDHDNIMAQLRSVTDQPVQYVINTHYHGDHSGGNAKLQAMDAIVFASDEARARMEATDQPGLPNVTVSDTATIHIGGKTVEIHPVGPAHTNGDVVVLFPDHGVLASGDIFANGEGTSAQLVDHAGGGSAKEWPKAVEAALELEFETVVPGHGVISTREDLEAYLERSKRFSALMSELVSQGKSRAEIEAVVREDFDWEDFHVQMALDGLIEEFR